MLKVERVTKRYGKTVANNDISFEVGDGQIAILAGPNGAGKSTIIKSIAGLLRFQGNITLDGFSNKSKDAKKILGYIPEMPAIYDLLTVAEHLEFIRRAYKMEDDGYGDKLLERFELLDKKDKLGKELSKGMQQKLSICCALVHKPKMMRILFLKLENMNEQPCHPMKEVALPNLPSKVKIQQIPISRHSRLYG